MIRCPRCRVTFTDAELGFQHVMARTCPQRVPEWVARARAKRLPAKEYAA